MWMSSIQNEGRDTILSNDSTIFAIIVTGPSNPRGSKINAGKSNEARKFERISDES